MALIDTIDSLVVLENSAIAQYEAEKAVLLRIGFNGRAKKICHYIKEEEWHRDQLMKVMSFLDPKRIPDVKTVTGVSNTSDIPTQLGYDLASEQNMIAAYNAAIVEAVAARDDYTRRILEHNLKDEEKHAQNILVNQSRISIVGIQAWGPTQF